MARRPRTHAGKRRARKALAPNLIGAGLVLLVAPLFLGSSPLAAGLRPFAVLGGLLLATGCGLLWWQIRSRVAPPPVTPTTGTPRPLPRLSRLTSEAPPIMPRVAAEPEQRRAEGAHDTWGPMVLEAIEWRRFEALVEALFSQAGFETKSQSHGADEGVDIWLYSRNMPGAPVSVVQCKHWKGKRIGVDKVRELRGVMAAKGVTRGQFATTSTFTPDAEAFAKDNGISLLDIHGLLMLIGRRTDEQQAALLKVALDGEYWRPTCVSCGVKMVERSPRKGGAAFWGCAAYPKCKTTMPMSNATRGRHPHRATTHHAL